MIQSTIIEKDESGLTQVLTALDKLTEERFIEGIRYRLRDAYEIGILVEHLKACQCRLNIEYRALVRFSENFIRLFATPNNKCFDTAQVLFNKMRSTLARLKEIFKKMTPISRIELPTGAPTPSVFENSSLVSDSTQLDLFGLDSFPQEAKELYRVIDTLFTSASTALGLCHQMIEKEKEVRGDPVLARQSYESTVSDILNAFGGLKCILPADVDDAGMYESWRSKKSDNDFYQKWYHVPDDKQLKLFVIRRDVEQAQCEGLSQEENFYWREDRSKALRVRAVIEKFELVTGAQGQKGKLASKVIVEFLKWCGVAKSQEHRLYMEYFKKTYLASHPQACLKPLGWSTIDDERKNQEGMHSAEWLSNAFEKRLGAIFPSTPNRA